MGRWFSAAVAVALFAGVAGSAAAAPPVVAPDRIPSLNELIADLTRRWRPDCWAAGPKTDVALRVRLGADGRLLGAPEWIDPVETDAGRAAHARAVEAVAGGQPYRIPPEAAGKPIAIRFAAAEACPAH